jgi:NADH-quinone oxidoreductase subunit F
MKEILKDIAEGRATSNDLDTLSDLGAMIKDFALCGLGGGAPPLILNGIRDFEKDFKAHITTGRCPWTE